MTSPYITSGKAVQNMGRIIFALIIRESSTRYGRLKIGYLWAFLEPMLFIATLSILFSYVRTLQSGNMPVILFYITGIMTFFMFRNIMSQCMTSIRQNFQLLTFPQVHVFEVILARAILEIATFFIVFTIIVVAVSYLDINPVKIEDYLMLLLCIILLSLIALGGGFASAALIPLFPSTQMFINGLLIRPLFFVSGIFFTVDILPENIRTLALYNPVLQAIEIFRSAFFYEYESQYADLSYLITFSVASLFMGLLIQRALKRYEMRI